MRREPPEAVYRELLIEVGRLEAERDALMDLMIQPRTRGGWPRWRVGLDWLDTVDSEEAARTFIRAAAGLGPEPAPRPPLSDTIRAIRAAGGDAWDKVGDVEAFLGREGKEDRSGSEV